jgi:hypothetical protein
MTYVLRLICTNGMTHRDCVNQRSARTRRLDNSRGDAAERRLDQIRRLTRATWGRLRTRLQAIRELQNERIGVAQLWRQFLARSRLSSESLLRHLEEAWTTEGREETAYGAFNALTRVATHATDLSVRQRSALAALAGVLANRAVHICPRCFSVIGH